MQQEGIEEVMIRNVMIVLLLYVDNVVLLTHSLEDAQKLMIALKNFYLHNGSKTKVMLVKTLNKEKPCIVYNKEPLEVVQSFKWLNKEKLCIVYNKEPLEVVESFKYLGLEGSSNHKWKDCAMSCLEAAKRAYYAFENMCNVGEIKCWTLKKYLFDTLVTPVLLDGVEVWGGSISKSTWKEFENVQKRFLTKIFQIKTQTPYMLLLLESGTLLIEGMGMERVVGYMLKMQKRASHRLSKIA
ncbi:hypothetical protein L7F22_069290 [Adiantum nelumboides]|nr:hypothetical protein [Adiantum nelumboides]